MSKEKPQGDVELISITATIIEMSVAAEDMLSAAVRGLTLQLTDTCQNVIDRDATVDNLETSLEGACVKLMGRQNDKSLDIRAINNIIKIAGDLERIADYSVDIARIGQRMADEAIYKPLIDVPRYATVAYGMIHDSVDAYLSHDTELAAQVIQRDDTADLYYAQMRATLIQILQQDTRSVMQATYLLQVAHFLERICDHCTNIAERTTHLGTSPNRGKKSA
ncbi:MAG: phosphate signaling complex protein PhoU [Armatimonadota bacterium]|jgi:phosphate transport system protein